MKVLFMLLRRSFLFAALPAALVLASCDDDDPAAPSRGQIQAIHVAPYNKIKVDFLADDRKIAEADYGKATGYQTVDAGSRSIKAKANASQADVSPAVTQNVEKDKRYSVYVYNPTASTVGYLALTDDVTTPATGKANVRFVNFGFDSGSVTLLPQGSGAQPIASSIGYAQSSQSYASVDARAYTLEARQTGGTSSTLVSKALTFEAGKVYTVLLRGRNSLAVPTDEQLVLDVIANN